MDHQIVDESTEAYAVELGRQLLKEDYKLPLSNELWMNQVAFGTQVCKTFAMKAMVIIFNFFSTKHRDQLGLDQAIPLKVLKVNTDNSIKTNFCLCMLTNFNSLSIASNNKIVEGTVQSISKLTYVDDLVLDAVFTIDKPEGLSAYGNLWDCMWNNFTLFVSDKCDQALIVSSICRQTPLIFNENESVVNNNQLPQPDKSDTLQSQSSSSACMGGWQPLSVKM